MNRSQLLSRKKLIELPTLLNLVMFAEMWASAENAISISAMTSVREI